MKRLQSQLGTPPPSVSTYQAFPLHFCKLQAIKNWMVGRPGSKVNFYDLCNQMYSAYNHNLYSAAQVFIFSLFRYTQVPTFCSLVPRPHPPRCICCLYAFSLPRTNKKPGGPVIVDTRNNFVRPKYVKVCCTSIHCWQEFLTITVYCQKFIRNV